jgi:hypothetical protein
MAGIPEGRQTGVPVELPPSIIRTEKGAEFVTRSAKNCTDGQGGTRDAGWIGAEGTRPAGGVGWRTGPGRAAADKADQRRRLRALSDELDRYLARLYGTFQEHAQSSLDYQQRFTAWRKSHQPFHWLIDFYGIMQRGGFDVIIGNPPYLERSKLKNHYAVINYQTESCRDIYAWGVERCFGLRARDSALGVIIPVSFASSGSFKVLRNVVGTASSSLWVSHFSNRPGQLFNVAQNRLSILLSGPTKREPVTYSTRYHRWDAKNGERGSLFTNLRYMATSDILKPLHELMPKVGSLDSVAILNKIDASRTIRDHILPGSGCDVFLGPCARIFLSVLP